MLTRLDDYPIHQTPEPVAHPSSGDANFYDRYFFNGYTPDGGLFFAAALGLYPNRRVMDAAVNVVLEGRQHILRASRLAPDERTETRVGPISITVDEPMVALRLAIEPNEHGIEGEMRFLARTVPLEEPRFTRRSGTRTTMDATRFAQFGGWEGTLSVAGKQFTLDPATVRGCRDRSWGVRGVGERQQGAPPAGGGGGQFYWVWAPLNFDDVCTHFGTNEDADGRAWHVNGVVVPTVEPGASTEEATPPEQMDVVTHSIDWQSGSRRAVHADLSLQPKAGEPHEISLEPIVHFQMSGIGYGHPEWGHGMWKGEEATAGEVLELADVNVADPRNFHIQTLCRATMGDREGIGVLEQLVIGPHAPSGFTGPFDAAP